MTLVHNPQSSRISCLSAPTINLLLTDVVLPEDIDYEVDSDGITAKTFFDRNSEGTVLISVWGEDSEGAIDSDLETEVLEVWLMRSIDNGDSWQPYWKTTKNYEGSIQLDTADSLWSFRLVEKGDYEGVRVRART